ncbi:hypothetical protein [Streptomyces sp. WAC 06725]|uniref:hypothetical protein n=1 Tax=Streptomyces sp. WAC 06725 TaxID=2203209 RepID=UPI00163C9B5F|nr:hypothetical protein [Streptomyces sp. WAC 06725]
MNVELGDGSTNWPFPPSEWELRRRAARQTVDEARLIRPVLAHPPTVAERRMRRSCTAASPHWKPPGTPRPGCRRSAHRLHLLVQAGRTAPP